MLQVKPVLRPLYDHKVIDKNKFKEAAKLATHTLASGAAGQLSARQAVWDALSQMGLQHLSQQM